MIWPYRSDHRDNFPAVVVGQMFLQVNICRDTEMLTGRASQTDRRRMGSGGRGRGKATLLGKTIHKKNVSGVRASGRQEEEGTAGHRMSSLPFPIVFTPRTKAPFVRGVKARQVSEI